MSAAQLRLLVPLRLCALRCVLRAGL